jgi:hypothetical protein
LALASVCRAVLLNHVLATSPPVFTVLLERVPGHNVAPRRTGQLADNLRVNAPRCACVAQAVDIMLRLYSRAAVILCQASGDPELRLLS